MKINPRRFSGVLTAFYKVWHCLVRYDDRGEWQPILDAIASGTPAVIALWHNELFAISGFGSQKRSHYVIMVSQSRDGELIAAIIEGVGHTTVRGSSTRGGMRALLSMVKEMKQHKRVGVITVDGPRGPRHEVKDGILIAAQRAGALIFPIRALPRKKWVFNSWDRFEVPRPFSRCRIRVGPALRLPPEKLNADGLARERARLAAALHDLATPESDT